MVHVPVAVGGGLTSQVANEAIRMGARSMVVSTSTRTVPFESVIRDILNRQRASPVLRAELRPSDYAAAFS